MQFEKKQQGLGGDVVAARKLSVVSGGDDVAPSASKTVKSAASSGSYRDLLIALRDNIAGEIDGGIQARDLASLSRRLLEISKEIEAIDAADNGDDIGEAAVTPDEEWSAD